MPSYCVPVYCYIEAKNRAAAIAKVVEFVNASTVSELEDVQVADDEVTIV